VVHALDPEDDPGWLRGMSPLALLMPGLTYRRARQAGDGLMLLRQVTLSFTFTLVLFGFVLSFVNTEADGTPLWLALLVLVAVGSVVAVSRTDRRPLDCTSPSHLAGSYRTRFFTRMALAETVALFGFAFAFIGGGVATYYVAAAFTLVRMWTGIAPTRNTLARDQHELTSRGCPISLVAALRGGLPPNP
jgi:F0F1-type ATP synthase membrane subunit c/vacuolar-type H+-ATPase subunit K